MQHSFRAVNIHSAREQRMTQFYVFRLPVNLYATKYLNPFLCKLSSPIFVFEGYYL